MSSLDRSYPIGFCFNPLDRQSERRSDDAYVAARRADPSTRFMVFAGETPVLRMVGNAVEPLFTAQETAVFGEPARHIFLGQDACGTALFALAFDEGPGAPAGPGLERIDLRSLALRDDVPPGVLGQFGGARSVLNWHQRHRFCANCGAPSKIVSAGWRRDCQACGTQHFPRVDPVVIMLAIDGERCLLGRQSRFAAGMYSALAGFLEPGETIEDAVRREVLEEAGVRCSHVAYFASQPWPFPSSLMIGCFARAASTEIVVDEHELEDARWFSRAEVAGMLAGAHEGGASTPKPYAIAYHLLKAFVDEGDALLPPLRA